MKAFAALLESLVYTPSRNAKLRLLADYFSRAPDPDRGWALAAIAGAVDIPGVKPAVIRALAEERSDPVLFALSYDYVGDLAETVALIWPDSADGPGVPLRLSTAIETLLAAGRGEAPGLLARMLDRLDPPERFALLKLATGGLRVGVSQRLAKTALARLGEPTLDEIEEVWHGLEPPYLPLFAWVTGGPAPQVDLRTAFRPMMLANPIEDWLFDASERKLDHAPAAVAARLTERLSPADFIAEWKWDGIRAQAVSLGGERRLYSRAGEDIGGAFPDIIAAMDFAGAVDGELLVARDGVVAPFADLQKRLGRKAPGAKMLREFPAWLRVYDLLHDGEKDRRAEPLSDRRAALEAWFARHRPPRMDLSHPVAFQTWDALSQIRAGARDAAQEGLMLKRRDAAYVPGRPTGPWWKWKRAPLTADCVLMYAQRGHGKRSSFYSDYTFGAWQGAALTPVGKAYSGFTDAELKALDKWVRDNTTDRYGPVRAVRPGLVLEVAFDAVQRSTRHKSGLAMRFPRIRRIRWDKPIEEAERVEALLALAD